MAEVRVANDGADPATSDPQQGDKDREIEELKARLEVSENNAKGQQRSNQRLRDEVLSGVDTEAAIEETKLTRKGIERLYDLIAESPLADEDLANRVKELKETTERAGTQLAENTEIRKQISGDLVESGLEWEDDKLAVARAHYDNGNYKASVAEVKKVSKEQLGEASEAAVEARVEAKLRELGYKVNDGEGSGSPKSDDTIESKILAGDYEDGSAALRAWAASQES